MTDRDTPPDAPPDALPARRSRGDRIGTVVGFVVLVLATLVAWFVVAISSLATDGCFDAACEDRVTRAMTAGFVMLFVAWVVAVAGAAVAAHRKRMVSPWPWVGLAIVVIGTMVEVSLAEGAVR